MKIAAVLLFCLCMTPMEAMIVLDTDDHTLIHGSLCASLWGIVITLPYRVTGTERYFLQIGHGNEIPLRLSYTPSKQRMTASFRPFAWVLSSWKHALSVGLHLRLGMNDAAHTALVCGTLLAALGPLPWLKASVEPEYRGSGYRLHLRCIAFFRLGKLLLTAALAGVAWLVRKYGGAVRGNYPGSADHIRHANSP